MYKSNMTLVAVVLCLFLAACVLFLTEDAYAQSADQKLATQEGLGSKEWDEDQLPGKFEIGLAIGSVIAMIGVIKYV